MAPQEQCDSLRARCGSAQAHQAQRCLGTHRLSTAWRARRGWAHRLRARQARLLEQLLDASLAARHRPQRLCVLAHLPACCRGGLPWQGSRTWPGHRSLRNGRIHAQVQHPKQNLLNAGLPPRGRPALMTLGSCAWRRKSRNGRGLIRLSAGTSKWARCSGRA